MFAARCTVALHAWRLVTHACTSTPASYIATLLHQQTILAHEQAGEVDESRFKCRVCNKVLVKGSCSDHMTKKHGLDAEVVKHWHTVKDATMLRNGARDEYLLLRLLLTRSLNAVAEQGGGGGGGGGAADGGDGGAPPLPLMEEAVEQPADVQEPPPALPDNGGEESRGVMAPAPKRCGRSSSSSDPDGAGIVSEQMQKMQEDMSRVLHMVSNAVQPVLEVEVPDLEINMELAQWQHPEETKQRYNFPLKCKEVLAVQYEGFELYLTRNLRLDTAARDKAKRGIQRLLNIITVEGGDDQVVDFKGYLVALYKTNAMLAIMDWPLLDLKYGYARDLLDSVAKLCAFGIFDAIRLEQKRVEWYLKQLLAEVLEPLSGQAADKKGMASQRKQEVDGLRLENLPPAKECKVAVHKATLVTTDQPHAATFHRADQIRQDDHKKNKRLTSCDSPPPHTLRASFN